MATRARILPRVTAEAPTLAPLPARFARLVKIEHTVFALPFAYVGAFLAVNGTPSAHDLLWVTLAMVGARSLAMALNRLIDARLDARNPRTAGRELPSGQLTIVQVLAFCVASLALFLAAVWQLDPLVRWLWPIPVAGFVVYPYLKRVTWLCHFLLGAVDGLAPVGAWVAITGKLPWQSWLLGAAVAFWVAGFDFFYALFDLDVDRREGLHSIATRFGVRGAFLGARLAHVATVACLVGVGLGLPVGVLYWLGVGAVAALLAYEHSLVRPDDLRRLDTAFFTMNGVISVVFAVFVIVDAVT
jgi:4-hydroxybenzoate polyprenyltransferase